MALRTMQNNFFLSIFQKELAIKEFACVCTTACILFRLLPKFASVQADLDDKFMPDSSF